MLSSPRSGGYSNINSATVGKYKLSSPRSGGYSVTFWPQKRVPDFLPRVAGVILRHFIMFLFYKHFLPRVAGVTPLQYLCGFYILQLSSPHSGGYS